MARKGYCPLATISSADSYLVALLYIAVFEQDVELLNLSGYIVILEGCALCNRCSASKFQFLMMLCSIYELKLGIELIAQFTKFCAKIHENRAHSKINMCTISKTM